MKLTVATSLLQDMITKVSKCASNNKLLPLTSMLGIKAQNGTLTLMTTDMTNYMYVSADLTGDDFYTVVYVDLFAKLIANTTSKDVTLTVVDNSYLEVVGNGTYKIDIVLDGNEVVQFPSYMGILDGNNIGKLKLSTVRTLVNSLKPSLAVKMDTPCYTNYFIGDNVVATDLQVITCMDEKLFNTGESVYISPQLMDLVDTITTDEIEVFKGNGAIQFVAKGCIIYGKTVSFSDEQFQITTINEVANAPFESMCVVNKSALLGMLDRISLFVDSFTEGVVSLTFLQNSLEVSSTSSSGTELISYTKSENQKDFACEIFVNVLKNQIKAQSGTDVEIWYGRDNSIKLVDGNIISVVGLIEE